MVPRSQMANGFHPDSFLHSLHNYLKAFYKPGTVLGIENVPVNRIGKASLPSWSCMSLVPWPVATSSHRFLKDCSSASKLMGKVIVDGESDMGLDGTGKIYIVYPTLPRLPGESHR